MAEPGHPYRTDALDALRSVQRRWLAELPDELVDRDLRVEVVPAGDTSRAELALREEAERLRSELPVPTVRFLARHARESGLAEGLAVLRGVEVRVSRHAQDPVLDASRLAAAEALAATRSPAPPEAEVDQHLVATRPVFTLLVAAELASDDGYADERLARLPGWPHGHRG